MWKAFPKCPVYNGQLGHCRLVAVHLCGVELATRVSRMAGCAGVVEAKAKCGMNETLRVHTKETIDAAQQAQAFDCVIRARSHSKIPFPRLAGRQTGKPEDIVKRNRLIPGNLHSRSRSFESNSWWSCKIVDQPAVHRHCLRIRTGPRRFWVVDIELLFRFRRVIHWVPVHRLRLILMLSCPSSIGLGTGPALFGSSCILLQLVRVSRRFPC